MKTLNRTRRLLARKSFVLGIALLFTCLPMTTVFQKGKSVLVLARDYPDAAFGLLLNAVIAWIVYLDTCRRLRATGLEGPPGYSRLLWALVGLALGVPANAGGAALGRGAKLADCDTTTIHRTRFCAGRSVGLEWPGALPEEQRDGGNAIIPAHCGAFVKSRLGIASP